MNTKGRSRRWRARARADAGAVRRRAVAGLRRIEFWPGPVTGRGGSLPRARLVGEIAASVAVMDREALVALMWVSNALAMPRRM